MKRNCFCCEKSLKSDSDSFQSPPLNATAWETNGNYGSKLFDPIYDDRLEIYICDECLRKKAKFAYFFKVKIKKRISYLNKNAATSDTSLGPKILPPPEGPRKGNSNSQRPGKQKGG